MYSTAGSERRRRERYSDDGPSDPAPSMSTAAALRPTDPAATEAITLAIAASACSAGDATASLSSGDEPAVLTGARGSGCAAAAAAATMLRAGSDDSEV